MGGEGWPATLFTLSGSAPVLFTTGSLVKSLNCCQLLQILKVFGVR